MKHLHAHWSKLTVLHIQGRFTLIFYFFNEDFNYSNAASCIKNIKEFSSDWHVVGTFTVPCSKIKKLQATCAVIVLKSDLEKQYIISFRGTVGNDQLLLQALGANPETFEKFGKVGSYVQSAFRGLWLVLITITFLLYYATFKL
jgi:hypothetical protein